MGLRIVSVKVLNRYDRFIYKSVVEADKASNSRKPEEIDAQIDLRCQNKASENRKPEEIDVK